MPRFLLVVLLGILALALAADSQSQTIADAVSLRLEEDSADELDVSLIEEANEEEKPFGKAKGKTATKTKAKGGATKAKSKKASGATKTKAKGGAAAKTKAKAGGVKAKGAAKTKVKGSKKTAAAGAAKAKGASKTKATKPTTKPASKKAPKDNKKNTKATTKAAGKKAAAAGAVKGKKASAGTKTSKKASAAAAGKGNKAAGATKTSKQASAASKKAVSKVGDKSKTPNESKSGSKKAKGKETASKTGDKAKTAKESKSESKKAAAGQGKETSSKLHGGKREAKEKAVKGSKKAAASGKKASKSLADSKRTAKENAKSGAKKASKKYGAGKTATKKAEAKGQQIPNQAYDRSKLSKLREPERDTAAPPRSSSDSNLGAAKSAGTPVLNRPASESNMGATKSTTASEPNLGAAKAPAPAPASAPAAPAAEATPAGLPTPQEIDHSLASAPPAMPAADAAKQVASAEEQARKKADQLLGSPLSGPAGKEVIAPQKGKAPAPKSTHEQKVSVSKGNIGGVLSFTKQKPMTQEQKVRHMEELQALNKNVQRKAETKLSVRKTVAAIRKLNAGVRTDEKALKQGKLDADTLDGIATGVKLDRQTAKDLRGQLGNVALSHLPGRAGKYFDQRVRKNMAESHWNNILSNGSEKQFEDLQQQHKNLEEIKKMKAEGTWVDAPNF